MMRDYPDWMSDEAVSRRRRRFFGRLAGVLAAAAVGLALALLAACAVMGRYRWL